MKMQSTKRLSGIIVGALCAMLLAAGCGDDGNGGANNGANNGAEQPAASFTTYNVGLARGFVDYATDRTEPIGDAVAQLDTDVVCMQEAWLYQDNQMEWNTGQIDTIVDAASATFPHSYFEVTESTAEELATCNNDDTGPMEACVATNCGDVSNDNLANCALSNCGTEFNNLSGDCQECISVNLGGSIDEIIGACTGDVSGSAYSYGGHNGLLMLSKHEMTNTEFTLLDSAVVQRAVLHATVDIPEFGAADVYCTHLQANLSDSLPYPEGGDFASYEEEQAAQIDAINAYIEQTAQTDNVVLMGDMNTGPAVGSLTAEFPDNYAKFTAAGYSNAYIEQSEPTCTYCGTNTLNDGDSQVAIDHVFTNFTTAVDVASTERVLDETQTITTAEGDLEMNLSDHYGVTTTLQLQ